MKKGFTLIELMVVIAIIATIAGIAVPIIRGVSNGNTSDEEHNNYVDWSNPEYSRAMSERRQADEMAESNRLKREELELRKLELNKAEKE